MMGQSLNPTPNPMLFLLPNSLKAVGVHKGLGKCAGVEVVEIQEVS